jgi:DNA modification methylase
MAYTLHHGDCLDVLRTLPDNSVDAIVTDPPYGLSFMGKRWDYDVPSEEVWAECLRVLKPGGHLLAFAGTRTQHRMAVRIEDAGFEIRDMIAWVYGSGFPKSHDVSKAIDKAAGAEREVVGGYKRGMAMHPGNEGADNWRENYTGEVAITAPATPEAQQWAGWGTALKPALEPITVARKPLIGTVAENVLTWGTGGVNVDGCRVDFVSDADRKESTDKNQHLDFGTPPLTGNQVYGDYSMVQPQNYNPTGRWPANFIHDGSEEVVGLFPQTASGGGVKTVNGPYTSERTWSTSKTQGNSKISQSDSGSAARFFYCAKASKRDRDEGCEGLEAGIVARSCQAQAEAKRGNVVECEEGAFNKARAARNFHPTVKPTDLMRYLCRLVTPPGGIVLDPFMGSGSTGKAAVLEDFAFIGIEREAEYLDIARARIEKVKTHKEA